MPISLERVVCVTVIRMAPSPTDHGRTAMPCRFPGAGSARRARSATRAAQRPAGLAQDARAALLRRVFLRHGHRRAAAHAGRGAGRQSSRFSAVFSDKDIRAQMTQKFADAIGAGLRARALLRRQPVQAGDRARRAAARQPRDGQHRAAGHRQPGARVLDPDRGLRLPRRRPHARLLRQRLRQGDGRPTAEDAARHQDPRARPTSAPARSG